MSKETMTDIPPFWTAPGRNVRCLFLCVCVVMMMAKLREQHRMFADKFIECRNAKQAYLYVYPDATERTAEVNGSRLRKAEDIDAYIREQMDEISHKPNIASAEEVLEFLSGMMSNPEAKDTDRIRCAELLGKRYALYSDKVQVDGAVPVMFAGEDDLSD